MLKTTLESEDFNALIEGFDCEISEDDGYVYLKTGIYEVGSFLYEMIEIFGDIVLE